MKKQKTQLQRQLLKFRVPVFVKSTLMSVKFCNLVEIYFITLKISLPNLQYLKQLNLNWEPSLPISVDDFLQSDSSQQLEKLVSIRDQIKP